jgi:hypothetical protein
MERLFFGSVLIVVYVLLQVLTGNSFQHFIGSYLHVLLDGVCYNMYSPVWIVQGGIIVWSPCLPDLNQISFYLWGHLRTVVCMTWVNNVVTMVS